MTNFLYSLTNSYEISLDEIIGNINLPDAMYKFIIYIKMKVQNINNSKSNNYNDCLIYFFLTFRFNELSLINLCCNY